MRILVLNPPFKPRFSRTGGRWQASPRGKGLWPPKWLAYTAGILEREGHEVELVDAPAKSIPVSELKQRVKKFDPKLIVCDTSTPSFSNDAAVASFLKQQNGAHIVMVGPHVSALPEVTLKSAPDIDFVAIGEYDYTIAELADALQNKTHIDKINGLAYREGEKIVFNEPRPLIEDLDSLPFVSDVYRRHLNIRDYSLEFCLYPYIDIMSGRGCPYKCIYCLWTQTLTGNRYRVRSLDNVFEEIDQILANMGDVKQIFIDDDTFTAYQDRVREFCTRIIEKGYHFAWGVNCRADIVDKELIELMAEAGCRSLVVGYESSSQQILDNAKKGIKLEKMEKFTKLCKEAHIKIHGDFMIGLPGETKESIQNTASFARKLDLETYQISIAVPYPGTEFYRWLKENDYLITDNFDEWLDEDGQQKCVIAYPNLSEREIEKALRDSLVKSYLRPRYLLKLVRIFINEPQALKTYLIGGEGFIKQLFRWYVLHK